MAKYQREVDERAKREIEIEIERIRNSELSTLRVEERERYREMLDREKEKMEGKVSARLAELSAQEERLMERVRHKERQIEAVEFEQRQKLLAEKERQRARENDFGRKSQLDKEILQHEIEKARRKYEEYEAKVVEICEQRERENKKEERERKEGNTDDTSSDLSLSDSLRLQQELKKLKKTLAFHRSEAKRIASLNEELEREASMDDSEWRAYAKDVEQKLEEARSR